MPVVVGSDRTRQTSDPIRNFKYQIQVLHSNAVLTREIGKMGFTLASGFGFSIEMVPYREGGWNTNPHKLPGMSDFPPIQLAAGVYASKPGLFYLAKQMFSFQWGAGTIGKGEDFRFEMLVRVLDHPVTRGTASGVQGSTDGAVFGYHVYNCWVGNASYGDLNAMDNQVLLHSITVHHEGIEPFYGDDAAGPMLRHTDPVAQAFGLA